jgi:hypothetical protein
MADNVAITPGSGATIAADDISGVLVQRVKIQTGADGSATDVSTSNPVPVSDAGGTISVDDGAGSLTVDGSVSLAAAVPAGSNEIGGVNQTKVAGTAVDVNSGNKSAGTQRIVIATDQPQLTNALKVDGSAVTQPVAVAAQASGGWSVSRLLAAGSTNATSVKASAGQVGGWYLFNAATSTRYLKLYNKASAPTVGTDTPFMTIPVPAGAAANVELTAGIAMGTGIAFALTTGVADSDTGAVTANDVVVNLLYK